IRVDQLIIGIGRLRILVEKFHVGMRWRAVEIEVVFFDILSMVAFTVGQAEQAFLENGVPAVPEGQGKAQSLIFVGQTGEAVFAPSIGARAGVVVGKIIPGVTAFAVVFPDRSPLTLAQVGAPAFPCLSVRGQPFMLDGRVRLLTLRCGLPSCRSCWHLRLLSTLRTHVLISKWPYLSTRRSYVALLECSLLATFQDAFGVEKAEELNRFCHASAPAGLMACAQSRPVITVKKFIE